jgi:hypothetical protein
VPLADAGWPSCLPQQIRDVTGETDLTFDLHPDVGRQRREKRS